MSIGNLFGLYYEIVALQGVAGIARCELAVSVDVEADWKLFVGRLQLIEDFLVVFYLVIHIILVGIHTNLFYSCPG